MMGSTNESTTRYFILLTFPSFPDLHILLFVVLFLIYVLSLVENIALLVIIILDSHLHTPMYFFLWVLSLLETCYTLTIIPQMLVNLLVRNTSISYARCLTQMYFFIALGTAEIATVTIMAYDRYVAVCSPLLYTLIMTDIVCIKLMLASFIVGLLSSFGQLYVVFQLRYCGSNEINHFFCDVEQVIELASTCDAYFYTAKLILTLIAFVMFTVPFLLVVTTYAFIIRAMLGMNSAVGRRKAFSSCSSHLILVTIQYNCLSIMYFKPKSSSPFDRDKLFAVIYTLGTPVIIPVIYSLRNRDVKLAFKNQVRRMNYNLGRFFQDSTMM